MYLKQPKTLHHNTVVGVSAVSATQLSSRSLLAMPTAVIDCGSGLTRAGYAGDITPQVVFPTAANAHTRGNEKFYTVGANSLKRNNSHMMEDENPIVGGAIKNWDAMEMIWEHIITSQLTTPIEDTPILLSEYPNNSKRNRERITEIMFETMKVPSLYLALKPVLSMYAHGSATGCVLQSGSDVTYAVAIKDGYAISTDTIVRSRIGGNALTKFMQGKLFERDSKQYPLDACRSLKERTARVSPRYSSEGADTITHTLPDGQSFQVGIERYTCAESNFRPALISSSEKGFDEIVTECINNCSENGLKKKLYENIVLAGGNTMFKNTDVRLRLSLSERLASTGQPSTVVVKAHHRRAYYSFLGGASVTTLSSFEDMWITASDYSEIGSRIVHQKCPYFLEKKVTK